ncbi:hypothetical protein GW17_00057597 [Ensete ventricosum]|nr:hypothetical protein GW17_00057597 [Ensete ventricosum]RZS13335.1 hypothetical protein BHM03_00044904 [Ensete ventricosum]
MISSLQLHGLIGSTWRRLQRSLYLIVYNQRPVQLASAILIALAILGQCSILSIVPNVTSLCLMYFSSRFEINRSAGNFYVNLIAQCCHGYANWMLYSQRTGVNHLMISQV